MEIKAARRFSVKTDMSVFKRLRRGNQENVARNHQVKTAVCKYWLEGRCTRNPCRFLHPDSVTPLLKPSYKADIPINISRYSWKNPNTRKSEKSSPIEKAQEISLKNKLDCDANQSNPKAQASTEKAQENILINKSDCNENHRVLEKKQKFCSYWVTDNCVKGNKCENLDSWCCGNGLSMVAKLEGHTKVVTGIVLPSGSDRVYCGSKDKSLRVWDCHTGHCGNVVELSDECGTLVNEAPWIFVGLRDMIKACNLETKCDVIIQATGGQVKAITMYEDILFAGMEDGSILSWKCTSGTSFSEEATSLKGHTRSVLSLVVGAKKLFSGSADHTIRVWDAESLKCMHALNGHTDDVTTVICWDIYLLSGSLDKKIKVWAATETGNIEEVYEHCDNDGILAFRGMHDSEGKPILLCSCKDNGVGLYDLPSFVERGRVFSRQDIIAMEIGPDGLFFTGDVGGLVSVWKVRGEI